MGKQAAGGKSRLVGRRRGFRAKPKLAAKPPSPPQAGCPAGALAGSLQKTDKKEEDSRYAV